MAGPIGLVRDGDQIRIDLPGRSVDLMVPADELARRIEIADLPEVAMRDGWLGFYQQLVTPLSRGGVLRPGRGCASKDKE